LPEGESSLVSWERSVLPGGAPLTTLRGADPGPTLALLGGVHGDEDEGVVAVHLLIRQLTELPLAGSVRAVAPASPAAWAAHSRASPLDGANLARCFPGDPRGGPTPALAAGITAQVIDGADLLIDLHSAGARYSMPLFAGFTRDSDVAEASRRAALAFGAPLIWEHPHSPRGRSVSAAGERGVPAIYVECAGGGSIRAWELDAYLRGVLSVMAALDMVSPSFRGDATAKPRFVYGAGDLDAGVKASHHGFFVTVVKAGAVVAAGAELGCVYDHQGSLLDEVRASREGIVMFLRRQARIQAGDVLFALASLQDDEA
jgi:predicted deacylase